MLCSKCHFEKGKCIGVIERERENYSTIKLRERQRNTKIRDRGKQIEMNKQRK
jgi:hypothetical protein